MRLPDEAVHDRFQRSVAAHCRDVQNFQALLASLANPKENPMTLFYDEAVEADLERERLREYDTKNAPKVAALQRLEISNAIEGPRPRETWVARDLRVVFQAARRVFGLAA